MRFVPDFKRVKSGVGEAIWARNCAQNVARAAKEAEICEKSLKKYYQQVKVAQEALSKAHEKLGGIEADIGRIENE